MPLFADANDTLLLVVSNLVTGAVAMAVPWVWNALRTSRAERRREQQEDDKAVNDRKDALITRQDKELTSAMRQRERLSTQFTQVVAHMMYLEGILETKGIKFRKFPLEVLTVASTSDEVDTRGIDHTEENGV